MGTGLDRDLHTRVDRQRAPHLGVAIGGYLAKVVGIELGLAITADGALIITFEHRNTVAGDGLSALAIDLHQRVVFDVLLKVALGMQIDQFLAQSVFNVQFVVAGAVRGARLRNTLRVL